MQSISIRKTRGTLNHQRQNANFYAYQLHNSTPNMLDALKTKSTLQVLHIIALANVSISYPIYNILKDSPEFFFIHEGNYIHLILVVISLSLLIPFALGILPHLIGKLYAKAESLGVLLIIAVLLAALFLPVIKPAFTGIDAIILAAALGLLIAESYRRFSLIKDFFTFLIASILVVPAVFLSSETSKSLMHASTTAFQIEQRDETPIIFVVFDEFPLTSIMNRSMEIDSKRFPNFARLQNDSIWFRNATAHYGFTTWAITSILTGQIPTTAKAASLNNYPNNLFTLFNDSYELRIFECVSRLNPEANGQRTEWARLPMQMFSIHLDLGFVYLHRILPRRYSAYLPPVNRNWGNFWLGSRGYSAIVDRDHHWKNFMDSLPDKPSRILCFLHSMLPHSPWLYFPSGTRYGNVTLSNWKKDGLDENGKWYPDRWSSVRAMQRHLLQVGYVDRLIGELIDRLKSKGIYDQSLIIIAADHGVSFIPGERHRIITPENYQDILPVPLFIKTPWQTRPVISDRNVQTSDILPTIAAILQISLPWKVNGISALDTELQEPASKVALELSNDNSAQRMLFPQRIDKLQTILRIEQLFGSVSSSEQFPVVGPFPELIGKPLDQVAGVRIRDFELMNAEEFNGVDLHSGYVPALIAGKISSSHKVRTIAVAVNGIVQGVTEPIGNADGEKFAVLVSEKAFRTGRNQIELLEFFSQN